MSDNNKAKILEYFQRSDFYSELNLVCGLLLYYGIDKIIEKDYIKSLEKLKIAYYNTHSKSYKRFCYTYIYKVRKKLNEKGIPFLWLYFSNRDVAGAPKNMIRMQPTSNVIDYIAKATYLVQLSDHEAFCYSIVEALTMGVPVITTPISVLPEIGVQDGQNAHVVPFNMDFDVEILLDVPKFEYSYDNKPIIKAWRKELGNTTPKKDYTPSDAERYVEVTVTYKDVFLDKVCQVGEIVRMPKFRAVIVQSKGFGRILS
jgi:hypothetical protein